MQKINFINYILIKKNKFKGFFKYNIDYLKYLVI